MRSALSNPFYPLLLIASIVFVATVLAHAVVPWDRQPEWLRMYGWQWALGEVAVVIIFGLLSMGLDHVRRETGGSHEGQRPRANHESSPAN